MSNSLHPSIIAHQASFSLISHARILEWVVISFSNIFTWRSGIRHGCHDLNG